MQKYKYEQLSLLAGSNDVHRQLTIDGERGINNKMTVNIVVPASSLLR